MNARLQNRTFVFSTALIALVSGALGAILADRTKVAGGAGSVVVADDLRPQAPGAPGLPADGNLFVDLAKRVVPSVVNISTVTRAKGPRRRGVPDDMFRKFFDDFFRQRGGGGPPRQEDESDEDGRSVRVVPRSQSLGTGFIVEESGLILTNNHVVADADEITIHFTEDDREEGTKGEVVGRDAELDLALIRVKTSRKLVPVTLGDSDALQVGEYVMAVGNPFGQGHSVTHGIISAKERKAPEFALANYLQTDAPINPGNSGGPLVNLRGEVIGINNAIDQRAQGIGFAIPINLVKRVLSQLKTKGSVSRGYIGVLVEELNPQVARKMGLPEGLEGALVAQVYPDEPAEKAGIREYDVVVALNGKPVRSPSDLILGVTQVEVGQAVPVTVQRGSEIKELKIKVGKRPTQQEFAGKSSERRKRDSRTPARIPTGMSLETLTPELAREAGFSGKASGALVVHIDYGGPADAAGLMRGDLIVELDQQTVRSVEDFYKRVTAKKSYLLRVRRSDDEGRDRFSVLVLDLSGEPTGDLSREKQDR